MARTSETVPTAPPSGGRAPGDGARAPGDDRYELLDRLGEGGMGVVWAAHDRTLDRKVALKLLHDEYLGAVDQERLAGEARAMARLSHPNVVAVYDVGERDGRTFVTMELVAGEPVSRWLTTPRPWREVVDVFVAAGEGLAAAHAAGVVHRDVKPSNILLGADGRPRVADFGVAHASVAAPADDRAIATSTTMTAGLIGSPAYMAPERLRGEPADARGDQFGFCVALYEALHGRRPYEGDTIGALREAIERGAPPPVRDVPRWLHDVVARGLAADPTARFASMHDLLAALRGPRRRRGVVAAAVGAGGVVAAVAAALAVAGGDDPGEACRGAARRLEGVWDAPARARARAAFDATGLPFAAPTWTTVEASLDGYARDWVAMHEASCRATHVERAQSAALLERRQLCLDQRLVGLGRAVDALARADAGAVERAPALARGLEPVADCGDPAYLAGLTGAAAGDARGDLPAIRAALVTGQLEPGVELADRVIAAARAAGDRGVEAEALVLRGQLELARRDAARAADTLGQAVALAGEAGATRARIDAWIGLSGALQELGRLPEAEEVLDLADAALRDAPDAAREVRAATSRGTLRGRQSRYADAAAQFERAIARADAAYGADSPAIVPTLQNLAQAQRRLGRLDDAARTLDRALALARALGDDHPETLKVRRGRAVLLDTMGRGDEAIAELRAVLAARRERFGGEHLDVAGSHDDLGVALTRAGQLEDALAAHQEALAIRERLAPDTPVTLTYRGNVADTLRALGRPAEAEPILRQILTAREARFGRVHGDVALGYSQLGSVLSDLARYAEAAAAYDAARAIYAELYGDAHASVATTHRDQAVVERRRGRPRVALGHDERALAIRSQVLPAGHPDLAQSLLDLAKDHLALGRAARAADLAERALAAFGDAGGHDPALARWILAQALARRDPARARDLAVDARARLAAQPSAAAAQTVAAIDAWLAAR